MILVIAPSCPQDERARRWPDGYRVVAFEDLRGAFPRSGAPDMVVSALVGDGFDAVEVARCLQDLGYAGPYRALSGPLPDPAVVRSEVRSAAPDVDFDVLVVSHEASRPE